MADENKPKEQLLQEISDLRSQLAFTRLKKEAHTELLHQSVERFALAMRSATDGLWDWDLRTNTVYYSPRWKSMLGYEEYELDNIFDTWAHMVHADDKTYVLDHVSQYLNDDISNFEVEMRIRHKAGHYVYVRSRAFKAFEESSGEVTRLIGTHVDISEQKKADQFCARHTRILEMIAKGRPSSEIYDKIALLYEGRYPGMRCSMLELRGNTLLHGGAPSLPKAYCDAVHGLKNGENIGSCGTSTYTGKRVLVENIETDPKWHKLKSVAMPFGMRSCWSEPIKCSQGRVIGAFGMYYDFPCLPNQSQIDDLVSAAQLTSIVMERDINQKKIQDLAYTDELTGLSSRRHFYLNAEALIKSSIRNKQSFAVLYVDLDNFKAINDNYGHASGDLLLKTVAQRLSKACRDVDFIARLSGDEFCIIVKAGDDVNNSIDVAKRCLTLVGQSAVINNHKLFPACSIGIAHYPIDGTELKVLMKAADSALYKAKKMGKHCYAVYQPEQARKDDYLKKLEQCLKAAIEQKELSLVYQPKIDVKSGKITSVEALCRWQHPVFGHIAPLEFIGLAERTGMIKPLTEWVIKTACNQASLWKNMGLSQIRMAVNISPSYFLDHELVPLIEKSLVETGLAPEELELEITEGVVQTDKNNLAVFEQLKSVGIMLAIDDFGSGYSSFASLKHINVDFLKIDKHFVDDILHDQKAGLLVNSMIEMGHNLGHEITAEGIEQIEQFEMLKRFGCDSAQGYLFSKPINAQEMSSLLKRH